MAKYLKCKKCGSTLFWGTDKCPRCGSDKLTERILDKTDEQSPGEQSTGSSIGAIVGGVITILIGVAILIFVPSSSGEWPTALAIGAFITGVVMIYRGINQRAK